MSKIVFCNEDITDIKYSGFTISKVYACGGQLVYEKNQPTPCQTSSLPTPFVLNYNSKIYDNSTHTIPMTSGQTNNIDCVLTGDVQNVVAYQDHISLANTTNVKALVSGNGQFNNHCCITIVAKAVNPSSTIGSDLLVNRTTSGYNWMFRWTKDKVMFHGTEQINGVAVSSSEPNIVSVTADGAEFDPGLHFKNHTTGDELIVDGFTFGNRYLTSGGTMFAEYADNDSNAHFWNGDFYWIYMTDRILSPSQIEKVIEYNESCFGVIFAWNKAPETDYVCDTETHTKYYKEYYQYSMDSGATWNNVYPTSSRTSDDVIEYDSADCGYAVPRKCQLIYSNSSTYDVPCDTGSTLTQSNVRGNQSQPYSAITEAIMGNCTTIIGVDAFYNCVSLTSATIGNGVTTIGEGAFSDCSDMTTCTIGSGVTTIGSYTFYRCTSLTSITIPDSVTSIGNSAFYRCSGLTSCTIGTGVTSIGQYAFEYCSGITNIVVPDSVASIGKQAFDGCSGMTSCTIGNGVVKLPERLFQNCRNLTDVTIGSGCTSIGDVDAPYTFLSCTSLERLTIYATTPPKKHGTTFNNTNDRFQIYVPADCVDAYKTAWSTYASRIQAIPNS